MDQVQFALWRFRNAEGVMDYVTKWDLNTCTMSVRGEDIIIIYDPVKELATIKRVNDAFAMPVTCPFKEFVKTLKSLDLYKERDMRTRHAMSYRESISNP